VGPVSQFAYRFADKVKGMMLAAISYPDEEVQCVADDRSKRAASYLAIASRGAVDVLMSANGKTANFVTINVK
jgi:hypothetical protein